MPCPWLTTGAFTKRWLAASKSAASGRPGGLLQESIRVTVRGRGEVLRSKARDRVLCKARKCRDASKRGRIVGRNVVPTEH